MTLPHGLSLFFQKLADVRAALSFQIKAQRDKDEPFVGVNIGTDVSNLLSPANLVAFLQLQKITHVRLYDADAEILKALAKTKIRVIVSVPNNQLLGIGSSNATAATWIGRNVAAYYPETLITGIAVGDEVLTTIPSSAPLLMPAIESLYSALVAANLHTQIKISTPKQRGCAFRKFPFQTLTPSKEMVDPNTLLHYTNVLDAMIDSVYFSMKNLNVTDVVVLVSGKRLAFEGDSKEPYATIDNADTYNSNLIKHNFDRSGTPLHPEITSSVYIYELFNEDLRSPPLSEANWGLFYGNSTPVYLVHVSGSGTFLANDTTNQTYCIATDGMDAKTLQTALDWACGPGRANCSEIQPGRAVTSLIMCKIMLHMHLIAIIRNRGNLLVLVISREILFVKLTIPLLILRHNLRNTGAHLGTSHGNCIFPGSKTVSNKTSQAVNSTQASGGGREKFVGFQLTPTSAVGKVLHLIWGVASCLFYYIFLS
ncbi:hypothetical protein DH2020_041779 [Rehmannia glutinosa]|uniref:X8 domain-containing protein n=1 Tax=Rehmannia glutinosa TaxID=99300 RepID=A0ABR0UQA9_REHGL